MNAALVQAIKENAEFLAVFLLVGAALFAAAGAAERLIDWKKGRRIEQSRVRRVTLIGMFSAIAVILMIFEIPLPFAPNFYKIDLSEIPVLVCAFAIGPMAGVLAEFVKVILNVLFDGTTTAFVGEFANFAVGASYIVPASIIYHFHKSKKSAVLGVFIGTISMTVFGSLFNAFYLLPAFSRLYGIELDQLVAMGSAVNRGINSISTLVLFAVVPMNLLKGALVSAVTVLIYKKISIILK